MDDMTPKDYGETVALFRHGLIGELAIRASLLDHGERSEELRRLSEQRVRPPGSDTTRSPVTSASKDRPTDRGAGGRGAHSAGSRGGQHSDPGSSCYRRRARQARRARDRSGL